MIGWDRVVVEGLEVLSGLEHGLLSSGAVGQVLIHSVLSVPSWHKGYCLGWAGGVFKTQDMGERGCSEIERTRTMNRDPVR